jgi:hypothetical protein
VSETARPIARPLLRPSVCEAVSLCPTRRVLTRTRVRTALSLALCLMMALHLVPTAFGADSVASQIITALPMGTRIELRLKNKGKLRGATGPVSDKEFKLIDANRAEHNIFFDDVTSVRPISTKSHTRRNVLIGVAIGVAALGISAGLILRCAPFGCGNRKF